MRYSTPSGIDLAICAMVARTVSEIWIAFELGAVNADKPAFDAAEARRRLRQFVWLAPVWLTRLPTFAAKARQFPGCIFVVGADTAERIVQPRFYGGSEAAMAEALAGLPVLLEASQQRQLLPPSAQPLAPRACTSSGLKQYGESDDEEPQAHQGHRFHLHP